MYLFMSFTSLLISIIRFWDEEINRTKGESQGCDRQASADSEESGQTGRQRSIVIIQAAE